MNNLAPMKNCPGGGGCQVTSIGCQGIRIHLYTKGEVNRTQNQKYLFMGFWYKKDEQNNFSRNFRSSLGSTVL